jgi:predicted MFS family arabinose efflux permease
VWASVAHFGLFQMSALATLFVLGPYVAKHELGGASAWATILVGVSLGALAGSLIATRFRPRRPLVGVFALLIPFVPQFFLLAAGAPVLLIAAAALVGQVGMSAGGALWFTALQEHIPAEARGRVSSYDWFGSLLAVPLGYALVGPVSHAIGVNETLVLAGLWTLLSSAVLVSLPSIRALGATAEPGAHPVPEPRAASS